MTWVKFEDRFPWHRKVRGLTDAAFRLHVSAVCWSTEHLTDGVVLRTELHLLSDIKRPSTAAKELTTAGLWDENRERTGWELHDFLVYNESRSDVLARREVDAERKRVGRAARLSPAQRSQREKNVQPESERSPVGHEGGLQSESTTESVRTGPARPDPTQEQTPSVSVAASPPKAKRATRIPEKWPLSEAAGESLWSWALENAPGVPIKVETDQWLDFHRAKGDTASDWTASWRTWMRRAQTYTQDRPARPGPRALTSGLSTTDLRVADGLALVAHYREQEGA